MMGLDNREENLHVFESKSKHQKVKSTLFKLLSGLIEKGIIKFNKEKGEYFK